jgi:hypothetical protein
MPVAEKVLIVGGMLNLTCGMLLGFPIVATRVQGAPVVPKYLLAAHLGTLLHAAVLLGLAWALHLSTLDPGWEQTAAWLLVIASALVAAKDTANWLTGVRDEFAERPKTVLLGGLAALAEPIGVAILLIGVLKGL